MLFVKHFIWKVLRRDINKTNYNVTIHIKGHKLFNHAFIIVRRNFDKRILHWQINVFFILKMPYPLKLRGSNFFLMLHEQSHNLYVHMRISTGKNIKTFSPIYLFALSIIQPLPFKTSTEGPDFFRKSFHLNKTFFL